MHKRLKKLAAVLLASAMLVQGAVPAAAGETQTETLTERQAGAEAPTESQTQAPTEPQTQAPTEPQTQAPTEPQTQSPTEPQTQAPTETQTSAETQTEPQTATPNQGGTQAGASGQSGTQTGTTGQNGAQAGTQGQAAGTEAQTQESSETERETEKQTGEDTQTKETNRSERENNGEKLSASDIAASLNQALAYLFAAQTVEGPENLLAQRQIASGDAGGQIVSGLEGLSLKLANAVPSSDVEVLNLYADKNGKLDTAQLDELYENHVIDVTKKYYVVNVIADHADQKFDFSGYEMILSGQTVTYEEETQPGDILYNFAALDGDGFTGYTGTLTLSDGAGLQGTYLAPQAKVNVNSNLAGAVYADRVSVADSVTDLLQIAFVTGLEPVTNEDGEETEAGEQDTEAAESGEAGTEATETEEASEAVTEDTEIEETSEAVTEDTETEEVSEAVTEDTETEEVSEADAEDETLLDTELLPAEEEVLEAEEVLDMELYMADSEPVAYSSENVPLNVMVTDGAQAVTGVTVKVRAAANILNTDGTVRNKKGSETASAETTNSGAEVGSGLVSGGRYYLELTFPADGNYCGVQRMYFSVDSTGAIAFENAGGALWDATARTLTITAYDTSKQPNGTALLTVTDGNNAAVTGAVFVVKDSAGNIIKDTLGNPSHYIQYAGTPVLLSGLAADTYYLSQLSTQDGLSTAADTLFTIEESQPTQIDITNAAAAGSTISASAQALCNDVLLTAELASANMKTEFYAALFGANGTRVSAVKQLAFAQGQQTSGAVSFAGLTAGTYYLAPTNELGEKTADSYGVTVNGTAVENGIAITDGSSVNAVLQYRYTVSSTANTYPEGDFSYAAEIKLTKTLRNYDKTEMTGQSGDEFRVDIYSDEAKTQKATVSLSPVAFDMLGRSTLTQTCTIKMTSGSADFYLSETDKDGVEVGTDNSIYTVSYAPNNDGRFTVTCGTATDELLIQNQINDSVVRLSLVDSAGNYISGVKMVIKDSSGQAVYNNGKRLTFESGNSDYELKNVLVAGETYYMSQVSAPSGYAPSADVEFTVRRGTTTPVVMQAVSAKSTNYSITVNKQVYAGGKQVYAQDDTSGTYADEGRYTFYAALFDEANRKVKVSDVQKITVKGLNGSATFKNLTAGTYYFVAETDEYGIPLSSNNTRTIKYANGGKVETSSRSRSTVIQNAYNSLPRGYRYTARLTIRKNVAKTSGEAAAVTETFYVALTSRYQTSVIKLDLQDTSSAYTTRRILLPESGEVTYQVSEVDASGSRVDENSFGYSISIDKPSLQIKSGDNASVTVTNTEKSSKVTLYLTKKVYEGVSQKTVNETFYVGLFKDAKFTTLYTKPIPMNLENKSELTLKLSLNLGIASAANIYVAETDENGKVIKNEEEFGYEIRVVNSTAAFTQSKREIQSIILNSVYGTVSMDDWNEIFGSDGNYLGGDEMISGNGELGVAAQTGDETPIVRYLCLMAAAVVLIVILAVVRKRRRR